MNNITKNPWTSIGAIIFTIGQALSKSEEEWCKTIGIILEFAGPMILGFGARDSNKSSEDVGAKK